MGNEGISSGRTQHRCCIGRSRRTTVVFHREILTHSISDTIGEQESVVGCLAAKEAPYFLVPNPANFSTISFLLICIERSDDLMPTCLAISMLTSFHRGTECVVVLVHRSHMLNATEEYIRLLLLKSWNKIESFSEAAAWHSISRSSNDLEHTNTCQCVGKKQRRTHHIGWRKAPPPRTPTPLLYSRQTFFHYLRLQHPVLFFACEAILLYVVIKHEFSLDGMWYPRVWEM